MKKIIFKYLMSKQWFLSLIKQRLEDEIEYVEYNEFAERFWLDNLSVQDKYEAMKHGWYNGVKAIKEALYNVTQQY